MRLRSISSLRSWSSRWERERCVSCHLPSYLDRVSVIDGVGWKERFRVVNSPSSTKHTLPTMLYLVGLGLSDEKDVTVRGLEAIKGSQRVYLEAYTSILGVGKERLVSYSLFTLSIHLESSLHVLGSILWQRYHCSRSRYGGN